MTTLTPLPAKQTELKRPLSKAGETALTLTHCEESQKAVDVILFDLFQTLRIFGKEPEALESMGRIFKIALGDYTIDQIRQGFRYYIKHIGGMPEPCDIATIIDRNGKPPFERSVYINIVKKIPEERSTDEWKYIKDYENFIIKG